MLRIRRIHDGTVPIDRLAIEQVQQILREQFPTAPGKDAEELSARLQNPMHVRFRCLLFVADDSSGNVRGFALLSYDRDLSFLYLDYIATSAGRTGGGVGGALYQRVRDEAEALGVVGIFLECLPDDRTQCESDAQYRGNVARLRFYERFGAYPIDGVAYDTPIKTGDTGLPYLVVDTLESGDHLRRAHVRKIVRVILEQKYAELCPPDYVDRVIRSFRDDPVRLRAPRYMKSPAPPASTHGPAETVLLVCNRKHDIHHVRERGYVESPVRISAILRALEPTGWFHQAEAKKFAERHILAVHDAGFVEYLKRVCANVPAGRSVYPYVFPIRNQARPPIELAVRAGYYCIDTFTPLNRNAYDAARGAVNCALTAAEAITRGSRLAYALVRPPGHHAEHNVFGGFCYFNNAAVAAHYLSSYGRIAILDVDYHHGNGQQNIFYRRNDVLTVSIHGHPRFAYPYFSGFEEELGTGAGEGFNMNLALPEKTDFKRYAPALDKALARIASFDPVFLVVALGLDTATGDPTGTWTLSPADLEECGRRIGAFDHATVVVQEGGYRTRTLGRNARAFFAGLIAGALGREAKAARK